MIRYAISGGVKGDGEAELLELARRWAADGVDYVQLREPQLGAGAMVRVARGMLAVFGEAGGTTKLLVNHRVDVAAAAGCGVHLTARAGELTVAQARAVMRDASANASVEISVSCHTVEEVRRAAASGVDLILFGPVYEKRVSGELVMAGAGVEALREACAMAKGVRVLALGGVTEANSAQCEEAGAAGIAGIRLFARGTGLRDAAR